MTNSRNRKQNPLSLRLESLRRLSDDSLAQVDGATAAFVTDIKCPEKTWGTSKSRSIVHTA
jgi:hypothetical protein